MNRREFIAALGGGSSFIAFMANLFQFPPT
jgi:hypothetical protein